MIIGGNSFEAFNLIIGAPTIYYDREWADIGYVNGDESTYNTAATTAWNIITDADNKNYIMSCSVGTGLAGMGLVDNHAYTLIGHSLVTVGGVTHKLYKIRNPWGDDNSFNGEWKDSSAKWTASALS